MQRYYSTEPIEFEKEKDPKHEHGDDEKHYIAITLGIVFAAFIISPMTECLGPVLELNVSTFISKIVNDNLLWIFKGLLAAIPLAYILPGLAYIQMEPHSLFSREKLPAVGLVAFGILVTVAGAAILVPGLLGDCRTGFIMGYCNGDEIASNSTIISPT